MKDWHTRDISDIVLETGTDINQGRKNLSSDRKRKKNNRIFLLPSADPASIIKKMASDASLSLLIVAYLLSCFIGSISDSITGILIIGIAFFCGAYIKYRSSLRISNSYRMLLPQAKVVAYLRLPLHTPYSRYSHASNRSLLLRHYNNHMQ